MNRPPKPAPAGPPAAEPETGHGRSPGRTLIAASATPEEAAAIVAALEQFRLDTQPPPARPASRPSRWLEAALLEGVSRSRPRPGSWGDPHR